MLVGLPIKTLNNDDDSNNNIHYKILFYIHRLCEKSINNVFQINFDKCELIFIILDVHFISRGNVATVIR